MFPVASRQRCRTHFMHSLLANVPRSSQNAAATLVRSIFVQGDSGSVEGGRGGAVGGGRHRQRRHPPPILVVHRGAIATPRCAVKAVLGKRRWRPAVARLRNHWMIEVTVTSMAPSPAGSHPHREKFLSVRVRSWRVSSPGAPGPAGKSMVSSLCPRIAPAEVKSVVKDRRMSSN